jgi:uncharacterized protein YbaR (Trm112 family)
MMYMPIKKGLLDILACPKCKSNIKVKSMFLVCDKCKLAYPILNDNVPNMLVDNAYSLQKAKKAGFKHKQKL